MTATLERPLPIAAPVTRPGAGPRMQGTPVRGSVPQVRAELARLRAGTRVEFLSMSDGAVPLEAGLPERLVADGPFTPAAAAVHGLRVRHVSTRAGLATDLRTGAVTPGRAVSVRVVDRLPMAAVVLDRRVAVLPIDLLVPDNGFVLVTDPILVRALIAVHRGLWAAGADTMPGPVEGPPAHLAPILPLLLGSDSDHVAAERLGISTRTYSRRIGELLDLLGTTSRFAAGVEAARRGWLPGTVPGEAD